MYCTDLNILDFNSTGVLAVALKDTVYLLNTSSGDIDQISIPSVDYVSSLCWSKTDQYLSVGTSTGQVQVSLLVTRCVCVNTSLSL